MREKRGLLTRLLERLDVPCEFLPGGFSLKLLGNRELVLYGKSKILEYGCEEIVLKLAGGQLRILGRGLVCAAFAPGSMTVTGRVLQLAFSEGGDED
jgi:sporulation protein YqfC